MHNCDSVEDILTSASKLLVSTLVPNVAQAVKFSHEFPTTSTPVYTYYNDYAEYKAIMNGNSNKILSMIQSVIDEIHGKANILDVSHSKSLEEKFNTLVSINDEIIDRITSKMDLVEFPERTNNSNAQNFVVTLSGNHIAMSANKNNSSPFGFDSSKGGCNAVGRNQSKLLASKNIVRPQNFFSIQPDNSHAPFLPILKSKPNASVDLQDYKFEVNTDTCNYVHPYLSELEELGRSMVDSEYLPMSSNPMPLPLEQTPLDIVDTLDGLTNVLNELSTASEIAVDLEHHSYRTFLGFTCLMQLSTRVKDYIVDTLALRDHLGLLNKLFTDPKIVKVLHGSDFDLMWLQRDFGVYIVNMFDTGQAARILQFPRFSLAYLLQRFTGFCPNKAFQLADWRIRPLPKELIDYARSDTHYLLYVAEHLRTMLASRDLLNEALERSRVLCLRIYKKPKFNTLEYLSKSHMASRASLNKRQLYALKHICILRDSIARSEDESHAFVLPNHMIHLIAERLPKETTGMFACCNPIPPLLRKYVADFHKIILDSRNGKYVEQEIDEDNALFDSINPENLITNFSSSHSTASRSAPHDNWPSASHEVPITNLSLNFMKENCLTEPSLLGVRFLQSSKSRLEAFVDPSRFVLQKLLDTIKPVQVSDPISLEQYSALESPTLPNSAPKFKEDPLFKSSSECTPTSSGKIPSPIKRTVAETIEVSDLGGKFHPGGVGLGRSAQSRALANLKNRQQQQQQRKLGRKYSQKNPPSTEPNRSPDLQADQTDVVIIRDQKLKRLPKVTRLQAPMSSTNDLIKDSSLNAGSLRLPPPPPLARLEIPMTPEIQAAIHQTPSTSGRRKRRSRGCGHGGGSGASSAPFSSSDYAEFTPPQPSEGTLMKRHNN